MIVTNVTLLLNTMDDAPSIGKGNVSTYPPPCASTAAVPEIRPKRRFSAHPVLRQGRAARDTCDSQTGNNIVSHD